MAGDAEQTDSSGKYTFGGGAAAAKKYWPTILKSIELVCQDFSQMELKRFIFHISQLESIYFSLETLNLVFANSFKLFF